MPKILSKTFLIGEYAVLEHAPALVLTTEPSFQVTFHSACPTPFHPDSPAGQYLKSHGSRPLSFSTHGQKGLGQSSAEFLSAYLAHHPELSLPLSLEQTRDAWHVFQALDHATQVSGADLIAQSLNAHHWIQTEPWTITPAPWPFPDLSWALLHTGKKLSTHDHLKTVHRIPKKLTDLCYQNKEAFERKDQNAWIQTLKEYQQTLEDHHLSSPHTIEWVQKLNDSPDIIAAKGCGAMGAEILWVAYHDQAPTILQEHALTQVT